MNRVMNRVMATCVGVLACIAISGSQGARAQAYPSQDVHFICGFAAGSGADIIVRFFAEKMRPLLGRTIIVENKPGALGNLATEHVARSRPDGHTIYVTGGSSLAGNMHILKSPSVDVGSALQIAATINKATMMLGVRADAPWKTAQELTAAMKQKGEKASYAFANPTAKVLGALYKQKAGLQSVEVAYRTGAEFLNDLYSGNIDYAIPDNIQAMAQARQGKMRILAVGSGERMQSAPDLPSMTELGYPMDVRSWWAALVPAATPRPVIDQLNVWFSQVVGTDEAKQFLASIASDPWISKPDEAQAYFRQEIDRWGEYVKIAKIEPQG